MVHSSGVLSMPRRLAVMLFVTSASDRFFDSFIVQASFFILDAGDFCFSFGVEVKLLQAVNEFLQSEIWKYRKLSIE